jgi:hypothetical protein
MNIQSLDKAISSLIKKRTELTKLGYDHPDYDSIEEALQEQEDEFLDVFGDYLEDAFTKAHKTFCSPNNDVLLPTAYIPRQYEVVIDPELGVEDVEVGDNDGIPVDLLDFPNLEARMLLLPNPTRIIVFSSAGLQELWWAK